VQPSGRERRRKGLVNRLRRVTYGVLLWAAAQGAVAAEEPGAAHARPAYARNLAVLQVQVPNGMPMGIAGPIADHLRVPQGAVPAAGQPLIVEDFSARLIAMNVDSTVLGALRDGVAVNFSMGDFGGLQLNLYKRRNARTAGQQFDLNPGAPDAPPARFWSLGGSLDLVRNSEGHREVVFVPQLLLDFDALDASTSHFQVFVQYAGWKAAPGQAASDEKVPQVAVKLRF
jgi:hypothetical protein